MKSILLLISLFLAGICTAQVRQAPVQLILDTDIGPDYDDVGAMAVMHTLADSGMVNILATMASNRTASIAAVLDVINTWYGRPGIPIGVVRGKGVDLKAWQKWDSLLVADYPHRITSNDEAEDALSLYRRILAQQPDGSVTICTIGFFTNLANLLRSAPDRFSELNGSELVRRKVKKLVSMAGHFPEGKEFNVDRDPSSSKYVVEHWPTQVFFSGFEIGWEVRTGLALSKDGSTKRSPVKDVFTRCIPMAREDSLGRMSWDETAVLVAILGYEDFYELQDGYFVCNEDGSNGWDLNGEGHYYLVKRESPEKVAALLNRLMAKGK